MKRRILAGWGLAIFLVPLLAAASAKGNRAQLYYQKAMEAYLAGEYDEAILMDTKALEANPQYTKANSLLQILISEKDMAGKTVIWIGGKPAPAVKGKAASPVIIVKKTVAGLSEADKLKLQELEERVRVAGQLLGRETQGRFKELTDGQALAAKRLTELGDAQDQTQKQVETLSRTLAQNKGNLFSNLLALLALLVAGTALFLETRSRRELERHRYLISQGLGRDISDKVVNINRA